VIFLEEEVIIVDDFNIALHALEEMQKEINEDE
jgi:hypothetical protein